MLQAIRDQGSGSFDGVCSTAVKYQVSGPPDA